MPVDDDEIRRREREDLDTHVIEDQRGGDTTTLQMYREDELPAFPVGLSWNRMRERWEKKPLVRWSGALGSTVGSLRGRTRISAIGVPMGERSGLFAFDLDSYKEGNEADNWLKSRDLPPTRKHSTMSGGEHWIYRLPKEFCDLPSTGGSLARGLDTRGEGGYIVWAGGVDDRRYEVIDDREPAYLPEAVCEELQQLSSTGKKRANPPDYCQPSAEDQRRITERLEELLFNDESLSALWHRGEKAHGDQTRSGKDYTLALMLARGGFGYHELVWLIYEIFDHGTVARDGHTEKAIASIRRCAQKAMQTIRDRSIQRSDRIDLLRINVGDHRRGEIIRSVSEHLSAKRKMFRFGSSPVTVLSDSTGVIHLLDDGTRVPEAVLVPAEINEVLALIEIEQEVHAFGINRDEEVRKPIPVWLTNGIVRNSGRFMQDLLGIARYPMMTKNGLVSGHTGYDERTKLWWACDPVEPRFEGAGEEALQFLRDHMLVGFPFVSEADRIRALALPLTLMVRRLLLTTGQCPGFGFRASEANSFKTFLVQNLSRTVLTYLPATHAYSPRPEEFDKQLLATVRTDPDLLFLDNLPNGHAFGQASLDKLMTDGVLEARELGRSHNVKVRFSGVPVITGNGYYYRTPDTRTRFFDINLERNQEVPADWVESVLQFIEDERPAIIGAYLKILECPPAQAPKGMRFPEWWEVVGGPLSTASQVSELFAVDDMEGGVGGGYSGPRSNLFSAMLEMMARGGVYENAASVDGEAMADGEEGKTGETVDLDEIAARGGYYWAELETLFEEELRDALGIEDSVPLNRRHSARLSQLHLNHKARLIGSANVGRLRTKDGRDLKSRKKTIFFIETVGTADDIAL
ncbi:bifunctional DNA primase/polymerase [Pseudoruegeria sp. HB172150]|uniref:bifunctional DNA primase/polymerase n=1 Tax=Pseudoruegeria sp. HB172150 TaxID=2721164 RepID=UPI0015538B56|nr:bifunctional DNA primase/polymerase [Pseudoruegeria sp. HB172150]